MNSTNLNSNEKQWHTMLQSRAKGQIICSKKENGRVSYCVLSDNMDKNYKKMSILEINDVTRKMLPQLKDPEKNKIKAAMRTLIDINARKLQNKIEKADSGWFTVIEVLLVLTIVGIPISILIYINQNNKRIKAEAGLDQLNNIKKSYELEITDSKEAIAKSLEPLINTKPLETFKEVFRREKISINTEYLGEKKVQENIVKDLKRWGMLRLNGEPIYSNSTQTINNASQAYEQVLGIFKETDSDKAALTEESLLHLTQVGNNDIIEPRFNSEEQLVSSELKDSCVDINVDQDILTLQLKSIYYELTPDLQEMKPTDSYLIIRTYQMPISELKAAIAENNPDLLKNLKANDTRSESFVIKKQDTRQANPFYFPPKLIQPVLQNIVWNPFDA